MYYHSHSELGLHCHWCGKIVPDDGRVKKGDHLYCRNKGKCKMAHFRAFRAYETCVTSRAAAAADLVAAGRPNGNGKRSAGSRTSSRAIGTHVDPKSNAAKRHRSARLDVEDGPPWEE